MIKHIVMWKFNDEVAYADKVEMKQRLEALKGVVPTLLDIEVGMDLSEGDASMDMVLYSEFETMQALKDYAVHPDHLEVVAFVKPLVCERAVVDYEV
jgi:hypothetical protein